jgi:cell division protease FtsH
MALGYTMSLPQEDRYLHSKTEFEDKIAGMLGGHVAEELVFGDTTTGASNDIEKATSLARAMVTQYGMSEALGPLTFGKKEEMIFLGREIAEQRNYSDEVAAKIDAEVRGIIDKGYERATEVLNEHRAVLDRLADLLIEKETIEAAEFEALWDGVLPPRDLGGPSSADVPTADETPDVVGDDAKPTPRRRRGPAPQPA